MENKEAPIRPSNYWRFIKRWIIGISVSAILLVSALPIIVYIYQNEIKRVVITELNKHLQAEIKVNPENIDVTIIKTFPLCALEFKEVIIMEAWRVKQKDTLASIHTLSLAFSLKDIFNKNYSIKKIIVSDAQLNLKVNATGNNNYTIWRDTETTTNSDSLKFALEKIELHDINLVYKNSYEKLKTELQIKNVSFSGLFNQAHYALKSEGNLYVQHLSKNKNKLLHKKNLTYSVDIDVSNYSNYTIQKADVKLNEMLFALKGNMFIPDSLQTANLSFTGKNLDIASTLSLLPEEYHEKIKDYSSEGLFFANGTLNYTKNKPTELDADFGITDASITYTPNNVTLTHVNVLGKIMMGNKLTYLTLKNITANLNKNTFKGAMDITNFENPSLKLEAHVTTQLEDLFTFYPIDTLASMSGNLNMTILLNGLVSELKSNPYSPNVTISGLANFETIKFNLKNTNKSIEIPKGLIEAKDRHILVKQLSLINGESDITLNGELPNFLGYLFDHTAPLKINAQLTSSHLHVEDFLVPSSTSTSSYSLNIPSNLELNLDVNISELGFSKFNARDIVGTISAKEQRVLLQNIQLNVVDGNATINAVLDASGTNLQVAIQGQLNKLNVSKLFSQLNNFGQDILQDKHLKGILTTNLQFSGNWSKELLPDLNSIKTLADVTIERGELLKFKPLESVADYIDVNELQHIKFSTLKSTIEIKDSKIILPKTEIKSTAINIDVGGTHTFDNAIDYRMRLLISELLAKKPRENKKLDDELSNIEPDADNRRSVFLKITGTVDNPIIKYDKQGLGEKIKTDLQQEKQTLKQLLKEEFGFFKKDSTLTKKENEKQPQKFQVKWGDEKNKKAPASLEPKKEDEEDY